LQQKGCSLPAETNIDKQKIMMKRKHVVLLILLILIFDQALKIWVKTSFTWQQNQPVAGNWFRLYFIENAGMAWGWKLGNEWGKVALTLFRLAAVIFGVWYIGKIIRQRYHKGFIICAALIFAGALGNLIDSMFYGLIFDKGMLYDAAMKEYAGYSGIANFSAKGYTGFLHGNVVDMLYFPIIENKAWPDWVPFVDHGPGPEGKFTFFSPIFNIADASISAGVITLLLFQKRFFKKVHGPDEPVTVVTNSEVNDNAQVL
jgi:signal peptidase II